MHRQNQHKTGTEYPLRGEGGTHDCFQHNIPSPSQFVYYMQGGSFIGHCESLVHAFPATSVIQERRESDKEGGGTLGYAIWGQA